MDHRDYQTLRYRQRLHRTAETMGGRAYLGLAEPQQTVGQGLRSVDRERIDVALHRQRQAHGPQACREADCMTLALHPLPAMVARKRFESGSEARPGAWLL